METNDATAVGDLVQSYMAQISSEQKNKSDDYFEGGYYIQFFDLLVSLLAILIFFKFLSLKVKMVAQRLSRNSFIQSVVYFLSYFLMNFLLVFPFSFYVTYLREHQYSFSNLTLSQWVLDQGKSVVVLLVLFPILGGIIYSLIKRYPFKWWIGASLATMAFFGFLLLIAPVFIAPMFNDYKKLEDGPIKTMILDMAQSNGVSVDDVYWYDASKQTKKISANVSGAFGTMRISLNDNLLKKSSIQEIKAVMAHELGHYILGHIYLALLQMTFIFTLVYFCLHKFIAIVFKRFCIAWRLESTSDLHLIPIFMAGLTTLFFILTPITNTLTRIAETQADIFGLNLAREPDGFAQVTLKLVEYRKAQPSPLEEFWFYDHPSAYNRILMAMKWRHYQQKSE